jgi:nicotinamidase-related amidase
MTKSRRLDPLPLPSWFNPNLAYDWNAPEISRDVIAQTADEYRRRFDIAAFGHDLTTGSIVEMWGIDWNGDFAHTSGALPVTGLSGDGGMAAAARWATLTMQLAHLVTYKRDTFDTHYPGGHVFFKQAHEVYDGVSWVPAQSNIQIRHADYMSGKFRASTEFAVMIGADQRWLNRQFQYYTGALEQTPDHHILYLWDEHCLFGTNGYRQSEPVRASTLFHTYLRRAPFWPIVKGTDALTEKYSPVKAEVTTLWDGTAIPGAELDTDMLSSMLKAKVIIAGGLAGSHCFRAFALDAKSFLCQIDPRLMDNFYIVEDCIAPVVVRDSAGNVLFDFSSFQSTAFDELRNAGAHVVKSTTPFAEWPGIEAKLSI